MSMKTYLSRHTPTSAVYMLGLLICLLYPAVILGQGPIENTNKAADSNLRSNLRVNPSTHAVEFEITLADYPQRGGGFTVPVTLSYSSKAWRIAYQSYTPSIPIGFEGQMSEDSTTVFAAFNGGWTSNVGIPVILHDDDGSKYTQFGYALPETTDCDTTPCYRIDRIFIRMPDNSVNELRSSDEPYTFGNFSSLPFPVPDDLYAVDGSRLRYQRSTQTLFMPDGSRAILNPAAPRFIDRNGNTLTYTGDNAFNIQSNIDIGITDTLGRVIPAFRKYFGNNTDVVYSLPGLNNSPINYTFKWKRLGDPGVMTTPQTLHYIDELGGIPNLFLSESASRIYISNAHEIFNPVLLHQILLPTGQSYTFTYNVYGELEKVVLPGGGYERFEYAGLMPISVTSWIYSQANRGVTQRHVSTTGNAADEVTWNYAFTGTFPYGSGNPGTYILTTTAPDGGQISRYLHTDSLIGGFGFQVDQGKAGMVYDERHYSAPNGSGVRQLLRRKLTEWVSTGSSSANPVSQQSARRNGRMAKEVAILLDTGTSNALTQTTVYNYDTTFQYNIGVLESSVAQYDWVLVSQSTAQTSPISSFTLPSQPLRTSETTNLLLDTSIAQATRDAYRARHLVGLPSSTRLKNSSGTIVAQASMQYDEYSLTTVGSVSGWADPQLTRRGNQTTSGGWLNTTGTYLQAHNTYDQFGNVRTATDAKGNQTQLGYSSNHTYPTTTTTAIPDPSGLHGSNVAFTSTTNYDVTTGLVLSTTDSNGQTTSMTYNDPLNRLTQVTRPNGGANTTYVYSDTPGDLYVKVLSDLDASRVMETRTYFDGTGREVRSFLYDGTPSTPWAVTDTYYDAMGRRSKVSNSYRVANPGGSVPSSCSLCTTTAYDALGRVISVTSPDNAQATNIYAGSTSGIVGLTILTTDPAGKSRKGIADALGRMVAVYEDPNGLNHQTTYAYDLLNNLVAVTQGSQQRFFMYDSLNRLIRSRNPEQVANTGLNLSDPISGNSTWAMGFQYDSNGNLTQKTDARGVVSTYEYDALDRNIRVRYSDTPADPDVKRFYDGATNGKGRFWYFYSGGDYSTGNDVDHTAIDSYDVVGRPLVQRQLFKRNNVWSITYQSSRAYNRAGGVTLQTYPSGHSVTYNYDIAGRLGDKDQQNLAFTGTLGDGAPRTYSRKISYDSSGQLKQEQFGTNTPVYHNRHYNVRSQLCDVRASNDGTNEWAGELGALVNHYSTAWAHCGSGADNNGNVLMSQTIINSVYFEDRYTYDALNRLTSVSEFLNGSSPTGTQQYSYDRWGNRNIIPSSPNALGFNTAFEKEDATNRLYAPGDLALVDDSRRIRYDKSGNQIKNTFTGYGTANFDAGNRITSIQDSLSGWSNYTYNADGQRTRRKTGSQETWQVYGLGGELLAEYAATSAAGSPQKEYGYRSGELLVTTGQETVWSEDAAPAGAITAGDNESWNWVGSSPSSFSGSTAHQSNIFAGLHQHYFYAASATLSVSAGDKLFAYVYLDPSNMPSQIMLQWAEAATWWEHRAYWGANNLPWGVDGTNSRRYMGPLPAGGGWVRLEVPASLVGLEGYAVHGMAFSMWGGRATWDRAGKSGTGSSPQWLVSDHLGTPRIIIDHPGSLANVKRHDYLPFGEELFTPTGGRTKALGYVSGDGVRQQFTQKERDVETGLDYFFARYYSSTQGRFVSIDPLMKSASLGDPQSFNRYTYVANNPVTLDDPDGLCPKGKKCYRDSKGFEYYINSEGDHVYLTDTAGTKLTVPPTILIVSGVIVTDPYQIVFRSRTLLKLTPKVTPLPVRPASRFGPVGRLFGALGIILFSPSGVGCGQTRNTVSDGNGGCMHVSPEDEPDTSANPDPEENTPDTSDNKTEEKTEDKKETKEKAVRDIIPGGLKRSKSYHTELETKTVTELETIAKERGEKGQRAKQMLKLAKQQRRLKNKGY